MSSGKRKKPTTTNSNSQGSSSSRKRSQAYNTASIGLDVLGNVSEAVDVLSPLKAACRATKSILDVIQAVDDNREDWEAITRRLEEYMVSIEDQIDSFERYPEEERAVDEAFSRPLIHYVELLENFHHTVANHQHKRSRSSLGLITKVKIDAGTIRKFNRDIEDRHRLLMEALSFFTAHRIQVIERSTRVIERNTETILTDADTNAILQLPMVGFVAASVHGTCLQGTRQAVLEMISQWAEDDMSERPIFWLCDIAGAGKSTVAMSAADTWRADGTLGGQFFFSMASTEASTTERFCSTMARDLVHHLPQLAPHVAEAVKRNPSIMRSPFPEQFRTLITGPLLHRNTRVIIVIDAIDECKSGPQRRELLDTLAVAARESVNLKIFITSRPDPIIEAVLRPLSIKAELKDRLHDASHRDNMDDIAIYVHQALGGLLPHDMRLQLIKKANGLFIWASTACRLLTSETTLSTPESIYERLISVDQTGGIDDVYDLVLERTDPESYTIMCKMLALLLAAFEPLTVEDLDDLLKHVGVRGSSKALLRNLGSVLTEDRATFVIQFRHPTLVEYLRRRCIPPTIGNHTKLHLEIANAHGQAASWCLNRLKSRTEGLKFNICKLESSFYLNSQINDLDARVSKFIPKRLQYASSYWSFHVAETDEKWLNTLRTDLRYIAQSPYALYWMEILSVTGGVQRAINGLRAVTPCPELEEDTRSRMIENRRFLMAFAVPIQDSAPHIYISALPFAPTTSKLSIEGLKHYQNTLKVIRGREDVYPGLPETLLGHEMEITTVAFSPDGSRIVSGSKDRTLRIWDAESGQPLREPLQGHVLAITVIAFSPDGSRIASGSEDSTVRIWDTESGRSLGKPLRGSNINDGIHALAFSPNGLRIVTASENRTIRVWDAETGESLGEIISDCDHACTPIVFSPDCTQFVSCSYDRTFQLWDTETGQPLGEPLRGHEDMVTSVAFSPDGFKVASGSADKTVRLWSAETGEPLGEPLRGHDSLVCVVAFSRCGSRIASASTDWTIRLWDTETNHPVGKLLRGHESIVSAIAFSLDGRRIASGSGDAVLRLWDADAGQPLGNALQGHKLEVRSVAFSLDGSRILSGSNDATIRLWDAETGQQIGEPLRGHSSSINTVTFSPDGSRIASASKDTTIRLWDAETGQSLGQPFRDDDSEVMAVAFSPDGSQIVSGLEDATIRLWDAKTGQPLGEPLRGHHSRVNAVAFSFYGSQIVSGSADKLIQVWDAETGQPQGPPLVGHESSVNAVAFSGDGSRIVSGSTDRTVRVWDAETGRPLGQPLVGHSSSVNAVAFSLNGLHIASGSDDKTVQLWNAETGQPVGRPLRGHSSSVRAVAFSFDGLKLVSGSDDNTVRVWSTETGQPLGQPLRGHESSITAVTFSPDESQIVSASDDKTIRLWCAETGRSLGQPLRGHESSVNAISFSLDGSRIASASSDKTIRVWDGESRQPVGEPLRSRNSEVKAIAFSPDGTRIVSGLYNKMIRLWNVGTGQPFGKPLRGHDSSVDAVAFSPDGSRIVSGSADWTIRLWDTATGCSLGQPFRGHGSSITAVAFSPDGLYVVSGSKDHSIRLWDAQDGQPQGQPIYGHQSSVNSVSFSRDGLRIVSGSDDAMIRVWEAKTGLLLGQPIRGHGSKVHAVAFSPGCCHIVSGSDDRTIRLWEAEALTADKHQEHLNPDGSSPSETAVDHVSSYPIPGFPKYSLLRDGWVQSSDQLLFWVPPNNRHGFHHPQLLLTMPTSSIFRATKLDFTDFVRGPAWANARTDR